MKSIKAISNLKVRASWGKTGNQAIQPYQTLATVALDLTILMMVTVVPIWFCPWEGC